MGCPALEAILARSEKPTEKELEAAVIEFMREREEAARLALEELKAAGKDDTREYKLLETLWRERQKIVELAESSAPSGQ